MSTIATPVDEVPDVDTLSATDRCDRCGAQAYVKVEIPNASVLLFCAHHYEEHAPALAGKGAAVLVDDRQKLSL